MRAEEPADSRPGRSESSSTPPKAGRSEYVVWKTRQTILSGPYFFARKVAAVARGTTLEVLERKRRGKKEWARVSFRRAEDRAARSGWTVLEPERRRRAGELAGTLRVVAQSPVAQAAKGLFEKFIEAFAKENPSGEESFRALDDAFLDPHEVVAFAREEGLKLPAETE